MKQERAERCGKLLQYHPLNRLRERYDYWGEQPVCGRRLGHAGCCLSEEVWQRRIRNDIERQRDLAPQRRAKYAELRAAGRTPQEARRMCAV